MLALAMLAMAARPPGPSDRTLLTTSAGVTWYLLTDSVIVLNPGKKVLTFWVRSDDPPTQRLRQSKVKIELACNERWYVPLNISLFDATPAMYRQEIKGDAARNWIRVEAGGPVDAAAAILCR
jgi:hypothetical protein